MTSRALVKNAQRSARKQRVFEAAAVLFQRKGFAATSMRDIASAVGLEPSSLYSHIRSKQELLKDICFQCGESFLSGLDAILDASEDPVQRTMSLIALHVRIAKEDLTSMTVFNDEWKHLEEPYASEFKSMRKRYEEMSLEILEQGISSGAFREVDRYLLLNTIVNSSLLVQRSKRLFTKSSAELTADITDLIFNGLLKNNNKPTA